MRRISVSGGVELNSFVLPPWARGQNSQHDHSFLETSKLSSGKETPAQPKVKGSGGVTACISLQPPQCLCRIHPDILSGGRGGTRACACACGQVNSQASRRLPVKEIGVILDRPHRPRATLMINEPKSRESGEPGMPGPSPWCYLHPLAPTSPGVSLWPQSDLESLARGQ